jgi:hypothetical protein
MLVVAAILAATPGLQAAQSEQSRSLTGIVLDANDHPLKDALVYIKNTKTNAVKTSYTEQDGAFRFHALSSSIDYEVHAEHQGKKSDTKTLSSFDSRPSVKMNLRIK